MNQPLASNPETTVRSFGQLIGQIEEGRLNAQLSNALMDQIIALHETFAEHGGKPKGKLQLTLELTLDSGMVKIIADHKVTVPKREPRMSVFWITPENLLTVSNPRQPDMFRDVNAAAAPEAARVVS